MNKALLAILFTLILALPASAQSATSPITKKDVLISKEKPSVYTTFERAGQRERLYAAESDQGIWLRLHNNTKWSINIATLSAYLGEKTSLIRLSDGRSVFGLREGVEISPRHGIEVVDHYESRKMPDGSIHINESVGLPNPPVGYNKGGHIIANAWLAPGRSVIFSVPKEHLAKRLAIFVSFKYEWETAERDDGGNEPEHRVYFRAADLPESLR
jgi:hypothetical protein